MTKITKETIKYLSHLSRIRCQPEQQEKLVHDLQQIVSYVEKLSEVNTDGVEPLFGVIENSASTPLRPDTPENTLDKEEFLGGAPKHIASLVSIPTIMKSE